MLRRICEVVGPGWALQPACHTDATWSRWRPPSPVDVYDRIVRTPGLRKNTGLSLDLKQIMAFHPGARQYFKPNSDVQLVFEDNSTLHFEHVNAPEWMSNAGNMLMVNQELITDKDIALLRNNAIQSILCKSMYCVRVMSHVSPGTPIHYHPLITPVHDPGVVAFSRRLILHNAGASWMKNTAAVVEA